MRILIAGASGAIGRPLVRRLRANQHEVFALTRSPDSATPLNKIGAEPVIADALDAAAVKAALERNSKPGILLRDHAVEHRDREHGVDSRCMPVTARGRSLLVS
jgi:nucleoside-diphosphate-sugar epimerase